MISNFLWAGLGGALGSMLRLGATMVTPQTRIPLATLLVNVLGSFVIGIALANVSRDHMTHYLGVVGFCGGFTTFSTFSAESLSLLRNGDALHALLYIGISLVLCIGSVYLGALITIKN